LRRFLTFIWSIWICCLLLTFLGYNSLSLMVSLYVWFGNSSRLRGGPSIESTSCLVLSSQFPFWGSILTRSLFVILLFFSVFLLLSILLYLNFDDGGRASLNLLKGDDCGLSWELLFGFCKDLVDPFLIVWIEFSSFYELFNFVRSKSIFSFSFFASSSNTYYFS